MSPAAGTSPRPRRRIGLLAVLAGLAVLGYAGYLVYRATTVGDEADDSVELVRYQRNLWAGHKLTADDVQATKATRRGGEFPPDAVVGAKVDSLLGRTLARNVEEGDFVCWSHMQAVAPSTRTAPPTPAPEPLKPPAPKLPLPGAGSSAPASRPALTADRQCQAGQSLYDRKRYAEALAVFQALHDGKRQATLAWHRTYLMIPMCQLHLALAAGQTPLARDRLDEALHRLEQLSGTALRQWAQPVRDELSRLRDGLRDPTPR